MSLELRDQYDKIYKYCFFKVKDIQLAEDLTQETFLKYFSQNTYINHGKPLAYLYTIARNLCIDSYRKTESIPLNDDISCKNSLDHLESSIAVKQAIASLPDYLQEIILLRFANDLSMLEISNITGLSRFALYRKINFALKQLKSVLKEEDFIE